MDWKEGQIHECRAWPDWTDNTKSSDKCSALSQSRAQHDSIKLLIWYRPKIQNLKNCTLWSHKKKKCTNQKADNLNNLVSWSRECLTFLGEKWLQSITHRTDVKTLHSRMSASRCCWLRKSQGIVKIGKIHPLRTMKFCTRLLDNNGPPDLELHWWHGWTNPICLHLYKCKPPHTIALNYYFCHSYLSMCVFWLKTCHVKWQVTFTDLNNVLQRMRPCERTDRLKLRIEWASKVLAGGGKPQSFSMDINTSAALPWG